MTVWLGRLVLASPLVPAPSDVSEMVAVPFLIPAVAVLMPTARLVELVAPGFKLAIDPPLVVAAPVGLFLAESRRLKDQTAAVESTKAYMIGWGWAFGVRFLIGLVMIGFWMLWAWVL